MPQSVVTSAQNRFFNSSTPWVYAPANVASSWDGTQILTQKGVTAPSIDCSHFVQQAMLGAGYNIPFATSHQLAAIIDGTSSSYYTATTTPQAGDVVVFNGHVGIVTSYNPATQMGTFDGAQSSGLGQNVSFGSKAPYWGTSNEVIGFLTPKSSAYDPSAATATLDTINSDINAAIIQYNQDNNSTESSGIPTYFPSDQTGKVEPLSDSNTFGGGGGLDDGPTNGSTWSTTTFDTNNTHLWSEQVQNYDSSEVLVSQLDNWHIGGSQVELFAPSSTVSTELENFSALNGTGTLNSAISNLTAGGSIEQLYTGLVSGDTSETLSYSGANDTGTLKQTVTDFTNNTSQVELFAPSSTVSTELENFSALNGTGTLNSAISNLTAGGSIEQLYTGLASGDTSETLSYSGVNDTGTLKQTVTDFTNNTSQVELFAPNSTVSTELENYSALNGTGILNSAISNLTAGGSVEQLYTGLASGDTSETLSYSGANDTGTLKQTVTDFTNNISQVELFAPSSTVSTELENYSALNGTGTLNSAISNLTAGGSIEQLYTGLASGDTSETLSYSGANDTGTLKQTVTDFTNNTSQVDLFAPSSTVSTELENFSALNGTGILNSAISNLTAGGSIEQLYTGLASGDTSETLSYSGANDTGTLKQETTDFSSGTSLAQLFSQTSNSAIEQDYGYSGTNDSGSVLYQQTITTTNGAVSVSISGNGDISNVNNAAITVTANTKFVLDGSNDKVNLANSDSITGSGNIFNLGTNQTDTISGANNTINGTTGDVLTVGGNGTNGSLDNVYMTGGTLDALANSNVGLDGASDYFNGSTGDTINLLAGDWGTTVTAGSDTINVNSSQNSVNWVLNGSGDTVNAAASTFVLYSNDTDTINGSGAIVNLGGNDNVSATGVSLDVGANTNETITGGGGDTINATTGDVLTVGGNGTNGSLDKVYMTGGTLDALANSNVGLDGASDYFNGSTGDTINLLAGDWGTTVTAGSDTINVNSSQNSVNWVLNGSGDTVNAAASTFVLYSNDTDTINGSGAIVNLGGNDNVSATGVSLDVGANTNETITGGGGDTINATTGDVLTVGGNGTNGSLDKVYMTGGTLDALANSNVGLDGASDYFNGSTGDTINLLAGDWGTTVTAGSDTINVNSSQNSVNWVLNGSGDTVNAAASTFVLYSNDTDTINGSGAIVNLGGNDNVSATGVSLDVGANTNETITGGGGDTINATTGDVLTVGGNGTNGSLDKVYMTGGTLDALANSNVGLDGASDWFNGVGGDTINLLKGDWGTTITAPNSVINVDSSQNIVSWTLNSSNDTVNAASSTFWVRPDLSSDVVNSSGATINLANQDSITAYNSTLDIGANQTDTATGSGDILNGTSGDTLTVGGNGQGGTSDKVYMTGGTLDALANSNVGLDGASDYFNGVGGDTINLLKGDWGTTVTAPNSVINVDSSQNIVSWTLTTSNDTVNAASSTFWVRSSLSGDVVNSSGATINLANQDSITAYNSTLDIGANQTDTIVGSNLTIHANNDDNIVVDGSHDNIIGGTDDAFNISGTYDPINAIGSTIDYSGSDTGDTVTGSRDTGSDWFNPPIDNPPIDNPPIDNPPIDNPPIDNPPIDDNGGGDGFAANKVTKSSILGTGTNSIYSYDITHNNNIGASIAENALQEVQDVVSQGNDSTVLEGAKWDQQVITWSFANSPIPNIAVPLSGYIDASYQNTVDNLFQEWANASGLNFEEVSDSANSDIRIGWADLNTPQTGLVGFTNYQSSNGVMQHAVIELENPSQNNLVVGNNNSLIYSGTSTTLSQVLLHEIGHALGLADNASSSSIMSYALGSNNTNLTSSDINAIHNLYSPDSTLLNSQLSTLVQPQVHSV